ETIDSIMRTRLCLKGPLETPVGYGERSANVTLRKLFETYGNIRPAYRLPGIDTPFTDRNIDLIVVRENVEDLYAGIEYMQTPAVAECLKLISHEGCEKISRLAFEVARSEGRKKVTCATKANIMKMTEGMLKHVFEEVSKEYTDIEADHIIIDNCAHQLVKQPEQFSVIVTTNMNGDIISDLCSGLVGGLGFAPSSNIGNDIAIFEAVHGSAPKYAGKNVINPTALLLSAVMMLRYMKEFGAAEKITKSLYYTMGEEKTLTRDVVGDEKAASTTDFTAAIIRNLDKEPKNWKARTYAPLQKSSLSLPELTVDKRRVIGVDIFIESKMAPEKIAHEISDKIKDLPLSLTTISSRGVQVFPDLGGLTEPHDPYRCRFMHEHPNEPVDDTLLHTLIECIGLSYTWMHIEKLQQFNGKDSFSQA
ncbi:MAG: isocitrate dehydrogenase, partial [Alphaproteobacteria bacterium]|nr:isocitrate dehydrogenase [Alphaproteobacteria bacterium]